MADKDFDGAPVVTYLVTLAWVMVGIGCCFAGHRYVRCAALPARCQLLG